jgi:hypothetical protein
LTRDYSDAATILECIGEDTPGLTPWERTFIEETREQFEARGTLSGLQMEKLGEIWARL